MTRVEGENTRLRHYERSPPSQNLMLFARLWKCSNIQFVFCSIILNLKLLLRALKSLLIQQRRGDHSAPIPAARALSDYHKNGKIGYMHIDCHLDSAPDWAGTTTTNASGTARAFELPNCSAKNMAHMGSRNGLNPKDWHDFFVDNNVRVIPMLEAVERGVDVCTKEIFDIAWDGTDAVYCSWDTDSLDASCMPGKTAPEPFGIKAREAIQIARIAGTYGADVLEISELCPIFDVSVMSTKLACCMLYHFLGSRARTLIDQGKQP